LHQALEALPVHLWNDIRRQRSYVNQVLARAEVDSRYKPARNCGCAAAMGTTFPTRRCCCASAAAGGRCMARWKLDWVDRGSGNESAYRIPPAAAVARLTDRLAGVAHEYV